MRAQKGYLASKGVTQTSVKPWSDEELEELDRMVREDKQRMAKGKA